MRFRRHTQTVSHHLLLPLLFVLQVATTACTSLPSKVLEAKRTIAIADSLDAEHQLYSDTAALQAAIGTLCKPITRYLYRNTLAAAYYYMGRNLSANNAIPDAVECYIACDRLHPDDPIRRGRVNTCMAYICTWQCEDSLSLVFYKRSSLAFLESGNNTRYAHSLLSQCQSLQSLHRFEEADSLWTLASQYTIDTAFTIRLLETEGLYFYEQHQYDSALTYFLQAATYPQDIERKCYDYMKIMQSYTSLNQESAAYPYAEYIVNHSTTPALCKNAYYTLITKAKNENNAELTAAYSHQRQDYSNIFTTQCEGYAQAVVKLQAYIASPHPFRPWKIWLTIALICCTILSCIVYLSHRSRRKDLKQKDVQLQGKDTLIQIQSQTLHHYQNTIHELTETINADRRTEILEYIAHLQSLYPQPKRNWQDYEILREAVSPTLLCFCNRLQQLQLSEKEITLCIYILLYNKATLSQLADYLCYSPSSIRTIKQRVAKKLGLTNATTLYQFLLNLAIYGTPLRN